MVELDQVSFEKAIESTVPSVVDFWAGWCMPCKMFAPVLEELSDELDGKVDFYKLNIDEFGDIAQKYAITSIPTLIIFKGGKPVDKMIGVHQKQDVIEILEKHM